MIPPAAPDRDTVTGRVERYVEANLFAREAFASPSSVLRHFRDDTGRTPHAYIKTRRLEEARRLIETATLPIGDVALLVGYESFAAFTTAFTRHFGSPPSTARARARGETRLSAGRRRSRRARG